MKNKALYEEKGWRKNFLTIFYGFVFLVSMRGIIIRLFNLTPSYYPFIFKNTFQTYLVGSIIPVISIFSIIAIILVWKRKLPKFNLIFPIYYLLLVFIWVFLIPEILSNIASSVEEYIRVVSSYDSYWVIFSVINFVYSGALLWSLWRNKK